MQYNMIRYFYSLLHASHLAVCCLYKMISTRSPLFGMLRRLNISCSYYFCVILLRSDAVKKETEATLKQLDMTAKKAFRPCSYLISQESGKQSKEYKLCYLVQMFSPEPSYQQAYEP